MKERTKEFIKSIFLITKIWGMLQEKILEVCDNVWKTEIRNKL
jgi:hypothetical protein